MRERRARDDDALPVLQALWRLFHALEVRSKRMQRTFGVTGPQRLVIRAIGKHPGLTAGAISEELSLHASTLTGILRRLEHAGMVVRRVDRKDRRRARFWLTARGRARDRQRAGTVEEAVLDVVGSLSASELQQYQRTVAKLIAALERG